jgi:hypothetical protein
MTDRLHDALSKTLDQYDERRRADTARERKAKDDDARFLSRFGELRRDLARPVFEAAGALLVERGHGFAITEQEFSAGGADSVVEAGISLSVLPAGMQPPAHGDHERMLSLTTRHYNKTVWIHFGRALESGGVAGSKGAYPLERIDRQLIEDEVVRLVAAVMAG